MDNTFSGKAHRSISQAKDEVIAILNIERVRHDAAIHVENEFHDRRAKELKDIIARLDDVTDREKNG